MSDPMNWDTSLYDKTVSEDIWHARAWILEGKLYADPGVTEAPDTGYPERVLVQISLRLT